MCAAATLASATAAPAAEGSHDVMLRTSTGNIAGTLLLPAQLPAPVALIVPGSGPIDRNGNSPDLQTNCYRLLAVALAQAGFASVRYDKRGVGASAAAAPSIAALRFDTYVDDVLAWMNELSSDKRFSHRVIAGHSEGSLIGMIVAQQVPLDAFVSLEGAGRPAAVVLREQVQRNVPPALAAQADTIIARLSAGQAAPHPPQALASVFGEPLQPYLISWFKYNPAVEIAKVRIPVTIVQGTADIQVTMADASALKEARPSARLIVVEGMNHVLKHAPDTSTMQTIIEGYRNVLLPADPHAVDAITSAFE